MKILFITHTTGYGGAAISLSTNLNYLLETGALKSREWMIAAPPNKSGILLDAYGKFNGKVPYLFWHMPFSVAEKGGSKRLRAKLWSIANEALSILLFMGVYNHILKRNGITQVHLNSFVFWSILPFLPKKIIKTIHIREMISNDLSGKIAARIINKYADKIIAISEQTAKPFPRATIVGNPYDMQRARQFRNIRQELKSKLELPQNSFIVSVFSPIGKVKGSDFLVEVIKKIPQDTSIHFILVGDPYRGEQKVFRELQDLSNAHIYPGSSNMDKFYAVTDILIRCEKYLPLGRTVFEGIYAGCISLLPISHEDSFDEIESWLDQIYLYASGNAESCAEEILTIYHTYKNGIIDNGFEPTTNVPESAGKLLSELLREL